MTNLSDNKSPTPPTHIWMLDNKLKLAILSIDDLEIYPKHIIIQTRLAHYIHWHQQITKYRRLTIGYKRSISGPLCYEIHKWKAKAGWTQKQGAGPTRARQQVGWWMSKSGGGSRDIEALTRSIPPTMQGKFNETMQCEHPYSSAVRWVHGLPNVQGIFLRIVGESSFRTTTNTPTPKIVHCVKTLGVVSAEIFLGIIGQNPSVFQVQLVTCWEFSAFLH